MTTYSIIAKTRYGRLIVYAALLALSPACSSETGIIVEVSKGGLLDSPATLEFFVGVEDEVTLRGVGICEVATAAGGVARFIDAGFTTERVVDIAGQNLDGDPYRLLLRPEDNLPTDRQLMVVAVARSSAGEVLGVSPLDSAVKFRDGQVLKYTIGLTKRDETVYGEGNGCVCARSDSVDTFVIAPDNNRDCDSATVDSDRGDCNDDDPLIHPDADEICDGVDSNCIDDAPFEGVTSCYALVVNEETNSEECYYGVRECNDNADSPAEALGECVPLVDESNQVPVSVCDRFAECEPTSTQVDCATQGQAARSFVCTVRVNANGALCPGRNVQLMAENTGGEQCTWSLVGGVEQGQYRAAFIGEQGIVIQEPVIDECAPAFRIANLVIDDFTRHTFILHHRFGDGEGELWELKTDVDTVGACSPNPELEPGFTCQGLDNAPPLGDPLTD